MTKLGSIDMKELPSDVVDEMSSADEQETQRENVTTPQASERMTEPVPQVPKKKRKMSEKQLEALKRGRAKKLEMNLKSREGKKKDPPSSPNRAEDKEQEGQTQHLSTTAPAVDRREKKVKTKKQKLPTPLPSPPDSEESDDYEEEYEREEGAKESDVERTVGKYLKRYMDKSMRREKQRQERYPDPPRLTRSNYDDILFV